MSTRAPKVGQVWQYVSSGRVCWTSMIVSIGTEVCDGRGRLVIFGDGKRIWSKHDWPITGAELVACLGFTNGE